MVSASNTITLHLSKFINSQKLINYYKTRNTVQLSFCVDLGPLIGVLNSLWLVKNDFPMINTTKLS